MVLFPNLLKKTTSWRSKLLTLQCEHFHCLSVVSQDYFFVWSEVFPWSLETVPPFKTMCSGQIIILHQPIDLWFPWNKGKLPSSATFLGFGRVMSLSFDQRCSFAFETYQTPPFAACPHCRPVIRWVLESLRKGTSSWKLVNYIYGKILDVLTSCWNRKPFPSCWLFDPAPPLAVRLVCKLFTGRNSKKQYFKDSDNPWVSENVQLKKNSSSNLKSKYASFKKPCFSGRVRFAQVLFTFFWYTWSILINGVSQSLCTSDQGAPSSIQIQCMRTSSA